MLNRRPVNTTRRLDPDSRVRFISIRDALYGLGKEGPVLLCCICDVPHMIPPLLRAARDANSVIALSPGASFAGNRGIYSFFDYIRCTAEEIGTMKPIVLINEPLVLESTDFKVNADRVHSLIDAGFTGISLLVKNRDTLENPRIIAEIMEAAMERELGVEILLPHGSETEAGMLAGALSVLGARPSLMGFSGDATGIRFLSEEVEPIGASWKESGVVSDLRRALRSALEANVRMVTVKSFFTVIIKDCILRNYPKLKHKNNKTDLERKLESLSPGEIDRLEARLYAQTEDLLALLRTEGSCHWIRSRLRERQ